ncbi:MAG: PHB depolymerase family esterase, partial [Clostridiales bacterium]|nr:PHB depolymerase family esterase [Clostridiales bacterium]
MNRYFQYPNQDLWKTEKWESKISTVFGLIKWIGANSPKNTTPYPAAQKYENYRELPCYNPKSNAVSLPEVIDYWASRDVYVEVRSQGGLAWILVAPTRCMKDFSLKTPGIFSMDNVDLTDPWWAMRLLEEKQALNEMVAQEQNTIMVYLACDGPDLSRVYVNILQEAYVMAPADTKEIYLDVSPVVKAGASLKEIPDFTYVDENGEPFADPDGEIIAYGQAKVPVINVTNRWENRTSLSRDQMAGAKWCNTEYDLQRLIHSQSGAELAEGFAVEYAFDDVYDPDFVEYWRSRGLLYQSHELKGRHWKSAVPTEAMEHPETKLPVIAVMQEVNSANEHLAVTETSYFYEYFRIAAQGECILVNFVLEDQDSNDLLADILKEAFEMFPCDTSRVYIAGHSHNGFFSVEFAIRHPEMIAAVASFGDPVGFMTVGNLVMAGDRLEKLKSVDMPLINLSGMTEHIVHYPISETPDSYLPGSPDAKPGTSHPYSLEERVASYQLRLEAMNCPMKTKEDILATKESKNRAIRLTGIPGDRGETVWLDGFELYIVDVKNNAGKWHLRFVGEENMPHNTTPSQQKLSWSFLRRFARDQKTGETIE